MSTFILDTRTAIPHFPGIGRYVANLARELPSLLDDEEQLILLGQKDKKTRRQEDKEQAKIEIERLEIEASPFSLSQQWQIPKMVRTLPQNSQFAIHNSQFLYHSPYYLMPYRPGVPTVLTFYDVIPLLYPEYVSLRARLLFRLTTWLACRAADRIVSISDASSRDLQRFFGVSACKITTTPLAPDPRFQPQSQAEIERVRQKYNLPDNFLLYFGINKPHKNLVSLLEAYENLVRNSQFTIRSSSLVIAGAWDERYPEARERAQAMGDTVHILGRIDDADLPGLYCAATAFFFPSKYEGFGLPVLEAMACGTPVACSNTSSLPEVAGDAALLFDPQNIGEITRAMEQLIGSAVLRANLSQKGLIQAAHFSWQRTAETTLDVYRKVAK